MRVSTIAVTAVVLTLLAFILYPVVSDAGERRWITNERGETVGYVEPDPYGSGKLIVRDRSGDEIAVTERKELGDGHVIRDRHGQWLRQMERFTDESQERGQQSDWREGPAKRWGSHGERW